jgi:hypothetical protein
MESIELDLQSEIQLVVDYTKPLDIAIAEIKNDFVDDKINDKNFPLSQQLIGQNIEVSAKLFYSDWGISSENIIFKMDVAGYRPANLLELLVLGFLYPSLQKQFSIYALGSILLTNDNLSQSGNYRSQACHYRFVPCLDMFGKRRLGLRSFDSSCEVKNLYLAILK